MLARIDAGAVGPYILLGLASAAVPVIIVRRYRRVSRTPQEKRFWILHFVGLETFILAMAGAFLSEYVPGTSALWLHWVAAGITLAALVFLVWNMAMHAPPRESERDTLRRR